GDEPRELEHRAVYRVEPTGEVNEFTHALSKPNGIALSPDERTLYVAEHDNGTDRIDPNAPLPDPGPMKIYAFTLNLHGQAEGGPRQIIDFGVESGCDGMTVDNAGRLYLALRMARRPGVLVLDGNDGREVGFIPTGPGDQKRGEAVGLPSNAEFGRGDERNVLYVTVDQGLWRITLRSSGRRD
ncbi:MAG TPA: SMP-30/gluconolactonase/LRE family protein, partial [Pirellulales bacterium]|nr:SMP-30/gluconolactonase/LRE family protein [Pirellulales bacterium]